MEVENFFGSSYKGSKQFSQHDVPTANATGFGAAADDYMERGIDLNEQLIRNKPATFFMKVTENNMSGAGIIKGDIIIIDKSVKPVNGNIVIAVLDGEMLIRRYERTFNKIFLIREAEKISKDEVAEMSECKIWGKVISVIRTM